MLGMFPNHGYPSSYGYRDPYAQGYGYPRRPAPAPSARERYFRALAEEEAARRLYNDDLTDQYRRAYSYGSPYGDEEEYDDLADTHAQDYYRQQQLQQLAAQKELERRRRAQLAFEAEQRAREEEEQAAYAAEMQRRKQILEARRRAEAEKLQQQQPRHKRHSQESYLDELARAMFGQPRQSVGPSGESIDICDTNGSSQSPSPAPAQHKKREPSPPRAPTPPTKVPTPTPTFTPEEQAKREEAASIIQTAFRSRRTRLQAHKTLSSISSSLSSLQSSFVFPASPEFKSTPTSEPRLAYTPANAPIHGYEDALIKLLSQLDAVESGGDVKIRDERKSVARRIQKALSELDGMKDAAWKRLLEEQQHQEEEEAPTSIDVDEQHEAEESAVDAMDVTEEPSSQTADTTTTLPTSDPTSSSSVSSPLALIPELELEEAPTGIESDISIEDAARIPLPSDRESIYEPDVNVDIAEREEVEVDDWEEAMDTDEPSATLAPNDANSDSETESEETSVEGIVHVSPSESPNLSELPVYPEEHAQEETDLKQRQKHMTEDFVMVAMENPFFSF
jgi:hypothetical protein